MANVSVVVVILTVMRISSGTAGEVEGRLSGTLRKV